MPQGGGWRGASGNGSRLARLLRPDTAVRSPAGISFTDIMAGHLVDPGAPPEKGHSDVLWRIREALAEEAVRIGVEDIEINRRLGQNGLELIPALRDSGLALLAWSALSALAVGLS